MWENARAILSNFLKTWTKLSTISRYVSCNMQQLNLLTNTARLLHQLTEELTATGLGRLRSLASLLAKYTSAYTLCTRALHSTVYGIQLCTARVHVAYNLCTLRLNSLLSGNTTYTHRQQGVNYREYLHVLRYLLFLYFSRME